jgi:hypothetical protein
LQDVTDQRAFVWRYLDAVTQLQKGCSTSRPASEFVITRNPRFLQPGARHWPACRPNLAFLHRRVRGRSDDAVLGASLVLTSTDDLACYAEPVVAAARTRRPGGGEPGDDGDGGKRHP